MILREFARAGEEDVGTSPVVRGDGSSPPEESGKAASPALRVDLLRMLRILLDGPLPRAWVAETARVSPRAAGRMLDLLVKEGIVVVRRSSAWSARDVVEYRTGVGETVHRVLQRAGEKAGPAGHRSELLTQREVEIFLRLLGSLVRLDPAAEKRRSGGGDRT